jgi:hypothetical protein
MYIPGLMGVKEDVIGNAEAHALRLIEKISQTKQSLAAVLESVK